MIAGISKIDEHGKVLIGLMDETIKETVTEIGSVTQTEDLVSMQSIKSPLRPTGHKLESRVQGEQRDMGNKPEVEVVQETNERYEESKHESSIHVSKSIDNASLFKRKRDARNSTQQSYEVMKIEDS